MEIVEEIVIKEDYSSTLALDLTQDYNINTMQEEHPGLPSRHDNRQGLSTLLLVFLPILVVVLTVLIGMICFLVVVLLMKRRKGISLTEDGGPLDLSKSDGVMGEGGVEGVEARWLETVEPDVKEGYRRAKGESSILVIPLIDPRIPRPLPSIFPSYRHNPFSVSLDPRKGRLGMVV